LHAAELPARLDAAAVHQDRADAWSDGAAARVQCGVQGGLPRRASAPRGPESDLERLLDRALGGRHARHRDERHPRRHVARHPRKPRHGIGARDRAAEAPEFRPDGGRDRRGRSEGLYETVVRHDRDGLPAGHDDARGDLPRRRAERGHALSRKNERTRMSKTPKIQNAVMNRLARLLAGASLALALPAVASAHHSQSEFDFRSIVTVEGTVTELSWRSPHARLYVDVVNENGEVENWNFE